METRLNRDLIERTLREFVDALDRRVAHMDRLGEAGIVREAASLRKKAVNRIRELTAAAQAEDDMDEAERASDAMADEGGPAG